MNLRILGVVHVVVSAVVSLQNYMKNIPEQERTDFIISKSFPHAQRELMNSWKKVSILHVFI
jgi:hypothetical protein